MSDRSIDIDGRRDGATLRRAALGAAALVGVAAALLWWRFGSTVFFDLMNSTLSCF